MPPCFYWKVMCLDGGEGEGEGQGVECVRREDDMSQPGDEH